MDEEQVVVESHGFELGKTFLNPPNRIFHTFDRDRKYFLEKRTSGLPVSANEEIPFALMAGNNEVSFGIADSLSVLHIFGSFVDHTFVLYLKSNLPFASPLVVGLGPVSLDFATIRTLEIFSDRDSGYVWQVAMIFFDSLRN